jgi:hypothetical protein
MTASAAKIPCTAAEHAQPCDVALTRDDEVDRRGEPIGDDRSHPAHALLRA